MLGLLKWGLMDMLVSDLKVGIVVVWDLEVGYVYLLLLVLGDWLWIELVLLVELYCMLCFEIKVLWVGYFCNVCYF